MNPRMHEVQVVWEEQVKHPVMYVEHKLQAAPPDETYLGMQSQVVGGAGVVPITL